MGSLGSPRDVQKSNGNSMLQFSAGNNHGFETDGNHREHGKDTNSQTKTKSSEVVVNGFKSNGKKYDSSTVKQNGTVEKEGKLPRRRSSVWLIVKRKASVIPKGSNPLDWKLVTLIFFSLFCSASSLTFLFPFLPEMVISFGYEEVDKGYYAGLVASAVFAGRVVGSYFWGWLSDKVGRRPVMIITIFGNGLFSLIFGFTYNLPMAIITRFLTGLANGTVGTAKTVLYEISDDTNQAVGMSIVSIAWGAGIILGPTAGGLLASPSRRYPDTFAESGLFGQFPYLLPSMIIFVICVAVCFLDFFLLPETLHSKIKDEELEVIKEEDEDVETEQTDVRRSLVEKDDHTIVIHSQPNLHIVSPKIAMSVEDLHCESDAATYKVQLERQASCHSDRRLFEVGNGIEISSLLKRRGKPNEDDSDSRYTGSNCIINVSQLSLNGKCTTVHIEELDQVDTDSDEDTSQRTSTCWERFTNSSLIKISRMADVRQAVLLYTLFSFGVVGYEEIFTVWASTKPRFDGLGFEPEKIGALTGITCLPLLVLNLYLFPWLVKKFGLRKTFIGCSGLLFILISVTPSLHLLYNQNSVLWGLLCSVLVPLKIVSSCCFSATSIFVNNSAPPKMTGAVNGIAMTATAIGRSLAPAFGGSAFAWSIGYGVKHLGPPFDVNLAFFLFGVFVWGTTIYGVFVDGKLDKQKKGKEEDI